MGELEYLTDSGIRHSTDWHVGPPPRIGPYLVTFIGELSKLHLVTMLTYGWDGKWYMWGTKDVFDMEIAAWAYLPLPAQ